MEVQTNCYKKTKINEVNQGTYFKLKPKANGNCSDMGKRSL